MISGHALSSARSKLSKSAENSSTDPLSLIDQWSADVLRYWATSVKPGHDTPFSSELLSTGRRLINKLWNASRFAESRLQGLDSTLLATFDIKSATRARTLIFATDDEQDGDQLFTWRVDVVL